MLQQVDAEAPVSGIRRIPGVLIYLVLAIMLVTQLTSQWVRLPFYGFEVLHIWIAGTIVILAYLERQRSAPRWAVGAVTLVAYILAHAYMFSVQGTLYERLAYLTFLEKLAGVTIILLVLRYVYYAFGLPFTVLGIFFLAYPFYSHLLPPLLKGPQIPLDRILSRYALEVHGPLVRFASGFLWLLLFWGQLLTVVGAGVGVTWVANRLARALAGGPAMACLISSAFVGSFTGGGANNVAITGPFTIPAMKRAGYPASTAAAVEGMASNASAITPPILGTVAFIMADYLGVGYARILVMVFIPAALWYLGVATYLVVFSKKHGLEGGQDLGIQEVNVPGHLLVRSLAIALVPIAILVYMVFQRYSLRLTVEVVFVLTMALALLLRVETRWRVWLSAFKSAAVLASAASITLSVLALVADIMQFTGMGFRLGDAVNYISGGHLIIAALLMIAVAIVLAGPLPALPIYLIMALTFAPILARMGVPLPAAHFVAFYMGNLGGIIPPVAASALIGAVIASARYWAVCVELMKMGWPMFLLPILFLFSPELLLVASDEPYPLGLLLLSVGGTAVAYLAAALGTVGWLLVPMSRGVRALTLLIPVIAVYEAFADFHWGHLVAFVLAGVVVGLQLAAYRVSQRTRTVPETAQA